MSGPKTSRYTLTAAQRRAIERQIKEAQEKALREAMRKAEEGSLKVQCKSLEGEINRVKSLVEQINVKVAEGKINPVDLSSVNTALNKASAALNNGESLRNESIEDIRAEKKTISNIIREMVSLNVSVNQMMRKQEEAFRDETLSRLSDTFDISFEGITNRKALKECDYIPKILEALDEVDVAALSDELLERLDQIRKKATEIKEIDFLGNYYSISVVPFVKACAEYNKLWSESGSEYESLKIRYEYLCKELNREIEHVVFSEDAVSTLLSMISELEQEQMKKKEEEYICQCIDESMVELGYKVVGTREVTKKSGKHFRNELYKFAEGTVVNVTYADDGQITMELGAVDSVDRAPTDAECRGLVEDMTNFCSEYSELEKKLRKKGVEPKRIAILPPHAEYAQIIDISEYNMTEQVGEYHHKKSASSTASVMHKGE